MKKAPISTHEELAAFCDVEVCNIMQKAMDIGHFPTASLSAMIVRCAKTIAGVLGPDVVADFLEALGACLRANNADDTPADLNAAGQKLDARERELRAAKGATQ